MTSTEPAGTGPLTHRETMIVLAGLLSGLLLAALDQTIVSTALPTIVGEFGGLDHLSWVVTAYLLASTASMPLWGKVSDQLGRRVTFQAAIVTFLVGSVLCGAAQDMTSLIVFRAVQGLGGGGLLSLTFVIVGDIVPPRQRGRYAGYLTGVFAFASVAGPLIGGFFVDELNWRWIFYINIPIGCVALVVTSAVLHLPFQRSKSPIDFFGAALLVGAVTTLLLLTVWGGQEYEWDSPVILGLGVTSLVLTVVFVWWEGRAAEPILPLRLFRVRVFAISVLIAFLMGAALYGATIFLPLFLQAVRGSSATGSGLLLIPLMAGILTMSIIGGRLVSQTGRYKVFPVLGLALATVGMVLLSFLEVDSPSWFASGAMLVLGLGIGLCMPVLTVAVQNAVALQDLGAGTSAINFFRTLGGALGVAVLGAILSSRLASELATRLPDIPVADTAALTRSPEAIAALPEATRIAVVTSLAEAIGTVFLFTAPILMVSFLLAWLIPELPLRETSNLAAGSGAEAGSDHPPVLAEL